MKLYIVIFNLVGCSAAGYAIPPMVIYKRKNLNPELTKGEIDGTINFMDYHPLDGLTPNFSLTGSTVTSWNTPPVRGHCFCSSMATRHIMALISSTKHVKKESLCFVCHRILHMLVSHLTQCAFNHLNGIGIKRVMTTCRQTLVRSSLYIYIYQFSIDSLEKKL